MKEIKLSKDLKVVSKEIADFRSGLEMELKQLGSIANNFMVTLKRKYPKLNLDSASIDHKRGILVLPFEKELKK